MAKKEKLPVFEVEFIPAERRLLERRDDHDIHNELPLDKRRTAGRRTEDKSQPAAAGAAALKTKKITKKTGKAK